METFETVAKMRAFAGRVHGGKKRLSLVPTMGALHAGHEALINSAVSAGGIVVVSIFVNPLSFGSNENLAGYPRTLEADLALCERLKVDAVFVPSTEELYPKGYSTYVTEEAISRTLCGISRPTHFRGVATLAAKLLNIVGPDRLFLGQKDAQHVSVIRKMAADLNYHVEFVAVPTVREADGLAVAVHNRKLSPNLRREALGIIEALKRAREMVDGGVRSADRLIAEATHILGKHNRVRIIYIAIVDPVSMDVIREVTPGKALMCIATWVDEVRLTDNAAL